jgi:hypothetical protein
LAAIDILNTGRIPKYASEYKPLRQYPALKKIAENNSTLRKR